MKALITALTLSVSLPAIAQQKVPLPVICVESSALEKVLKDHKEEILFVGKDTMHNIDGLTINLFANNNTGSYTLVLIVPQSSVVCVVGSGELGKLIYKN